MSVTDGIFHRWDLAVQCSRQIETEATMNCLDVHTYNTDVYGNMLGILSKCVHQQS